MPGRSSNSANPNDNYKFTGYERDQEAGLTLDYANARTYDPILGRFLQVDPLFDDAMQVGLSPYNYSWNNPTNLTDPNGECPWCIGAIVGAALDYGTQVAGNIANQVANGEDINFRNAATENIDLGSIVVSAAAGATGAGLASKAGKLFNGKTLEAAEILIDGGVNAVQQLANTGEIDLKEVGVAATVGTVVRGKVTNPMKASSEASVSSLEGAALKAGRQLDNAIGRGARQGKINALTQSAAGANKQAANAKNIAKIKAASTGAVVSGGANRIINSEERDEN